MTYEISLRKILYFYTGRFSMATFHASIQFHTSNVISKPTLALRFFDLDLVDALEVLGVVDVVLCVGLGKNGKDAVLVVGVVGVLGGVWLGVVDVVDVEEDVFSNV